MACWCFLHFFIVCVLYVLVALAANDFLVPKDGGIVQAGSPFKIKWENLTDSIVVSLFLQEGKQDWYQKAVVASKFGPSLVDCPCD